MARGRRKDHPALIEHYRMCIEANGHDAEAHCYLAMSLRAIGDHAGAIAHFRESRRVAELDGQDPFGLFGVLSHCCLVETLRLNGQQDEAREEALAALALAEGGDWTEEFVTIIRNELALCDGPSERATGT